MIRFTNDECENIINLSTILKKNRRNENPRPISYDFYHIVNNNDTKWIFDRLDLYFTYSTGIEVVKSLNVIHLFDYSEGDRFGKHRDIYYVNQIHNIGVCLNQDYQGGDFVLYEKESKVLPKKTGEIYTFNHSIEHEILEVKKGHRWSLIGFYFYENLNLAKKVI